MALQAFFIDLQYFNEITVKTYMLNCYLYGTYTNVHHFPHCFLQGAHLQSSGAHRRI